jgi:hypothetical protein
MKTAQFLWLLLVIYTGIYLVLFTSNSELLSLLLQGQADGFSASFFNLMGLVPLVFLFDYSMYFHAKKKEIIPFLFGFLGGAYAILLGYKNQWLHRRHRSSIYQVLLGLFILVTTWVIISGILQITNSPYFTMFFSDSLVGIMTVDFLVLYIFSVYRAKQLSRAWYWSLLPIIGFGLVLLMTVNQPLTKPTSSQ